MQKTLLFVLGIISLLHISAQNLVLNPGAETAISGPTGWQVVSGPGNSACTSAPTNTTAYNNWTLVPDGSANYPFDHTTGAAGGHTFFSGCNATAGGPYELAQTIDVSSDATNIDAGNGIYTFSGYLQTPISAQKDQGRFIVDYLDASNAVLGTSYTSTWQSNFASSGTAWTKYTSTRTAPVLTRKIKIRLQAQVFTELPAINAYFDDISLLRAFVLPVTLLSFKGSAGSDENFLSWQTAGQVNLSSYQLQKGSDGAHFTTIATLPADRTDYNYTDKTAAGSMPQYYYRLKMATIDGKFFYSAVLPIKTSTGGALRLFPNPAKNSIVVSGMQSKGTITISDVNGKNILSLLPVAMPAQQIDISRLAAGLYFVNFTDGKMAAHTRLLVQ